MIFKLKKKDYDTIIKNMVKCLKLGDGLIFSGDCIHPVLMNPEEDDLEVNGTTTIHSFFPFILEPKVTMVTTMNIREILASLKSKNGIKSISLLVDDNTIRINTDGEEIIIATTNKLYNGIEMSKSYSDFDTFIKLVDCDDDNKLISTLLTVKDMEDVRDSKPVVLNSEYGKVRISKNLFSLAGPMPKKKPIDYLVASWVVRHVQMENPETKETLDDYVLSLHVNYKDIEAIHLYSVTPF